MRILFVLPAIPLVTHHSGAGSRYLQNFTALHRLGHAIHVARFDTPAAFALAAPYTPAEPRDLAAGWHDLPRAIPAPTRGKLRVLWHSSTRPVDYEFPLASVIQPDLTRLIADLAPDLIWVEGTGFAAAIDQLQPGIPWVFSQTDIQYRVRQIRRGSQRQLRDVWFTTVCRRAETYIFQRVPLILTGSTTDGERLTRLGARRVAVIPMAYDAGPFTAPEQPPPNPRIVHLGSLETTANRVGLESYLTRAHPAVQQMTGLALWLIGDASRVKAPLDTLLTDAEAVLRGHVADLDTVLRPYDISILPYEHDTGYRTKLPLLFSYGQVIVATHAAVAGTQIDGLGDVCCLVERIEDFPPVIARLAADPAERARLGQAARRFFEEQFTHAAVLAQYRQLLASLVTS